MIAGCLWFRTIVAVLYLIKYTVTLRRPNW